MLANLDGRQIMYGRDTVFTVEASRHKKAYIVEKEFRGDAFQACRLLRTEGKGIRRRLLINGKPVARN